VGQVQPAKLAGKLLAKAEETLEAARQLLASGFLEDSASRACYAIFHAARAALAKVGSNPRTHEGVVSEFGRRLVLEGVFPRDLGRALAEAKAARNLRILRHSRDKQRRSRGSPQRRRAVRIPRQESSHNPQIIPGRFFFGPHPPGSARIEMSCQVSTKK